MLYVLLATLAAGVCSTPHTDAHSLMQAGDEEALLQLQRTNESGYKYNASLLSIMLPEPRKLATIPLVVLHAHAYFPELQIQIRHSRANEEYVTTQPVLAALREKGAVVLTPLPDPFYRSTTLSPYEYSSMLEQKHFWLAALTRKVLLIQADTWLCKGARPYLKDFLQYDYVGAPFYYPDPMLQCQGAGNGGFSLRDVDAMLRVVDMPTKKEAAQFRDEDRFFCAQSESMAVAPRHVAMSFARDQKLLIEIGSSFSKLVGVHKLVASDFGRYGRDEVGKLFEKHCPGVSLMVAAQANATDEGSLLDWKQTVLPRLPSAATDMEGILLQISGKSPSKFRV